MGSQRVGQDFEIEQLRHHVAVWRMKEKDTAVGRIWPRKWPRVWALMNRLCLMSGWRQMSLDGVGEGCHRREPEKAEAQRHQEGHVQIRAHPGSREMTPRSLSGTKRLKSRQTGLLDKSKMLQLLRKSESISVVLLCWLHAYKQILTHVPFSGVSRSVLSNSLWPHGLYPARLLCPWNSPG